MAVSSRRRKPARRTARSIKGRRGEPRDPAPLASTDPRDYGWFEDCVRARWLDDGRYMALLNPLVFHQTQGNRVWTAPARTRTDGASIPPAFWSIIGGPFEGKYRDASVNHDYECCVQQNPWREVHRMFYDGMMARGEEAWRAKLMYFAVFFFGPRWPTTQNRPGPGFTEGDIARAAELFRTNPATTLQDIEELTAAAVRSHSPRVPAHFGGARVLDDARTIRAVTRTPPCLEPDPQPPRA
jgi:hypothetical protein